MAGLAVDFAKTGVPATMEIDPDIAKFASKRPDFLTGGDPAIDENLHNSVPEAKRNTKKNIYESQSVLGKLYRQALDVQKQFEKIAAVNKIVQHLKLHKQFLFDGYNKSGLIEKAAEFYDEYKAIIEGIQNDLPLPFKLTEAEILLGIIVNCPKSLRAKKADITRTLKKKAEDIYQQTIISFDNFTSGWDHGKRMALMSAIYTTTYSNAADFIAEQSEDVTDDDEENFKLPKLILGLPWMLFSTLEEKNLCKNHSFVK